MRREYVFIVGCARSGTSLVREILRMSERVCIAPETHFLSRPRLAAGGRIKAWGDLTDDSNVDRMVDFMWSGREVVGSAYWAWLQRNVDRESFREAVRASDRTERGVFQVLMQTYADKTRGGMTEGLVLGEKTPAHFHYIPTLLEWFPQAKIIHTFRDPRAILVSELKKMRRFGREGPKRLWRPLPAWMLEPLELPVELIHTTRSWLAAADWHARCEEQYPENYTLMRFEDLVTEPERQVRRLCSFLDVPFETPMVTDIQVVGSSYRSQHRSGAGFDRSALDRWKSSLHPALDLWFRLLAGQRMKEFGYT